MQVEKRWVIKAGYEFVAIYENGYFYYTNFWDCTKFSSLEDAQKIVDLDWGKFKTAYWEIYATDEVGLKFVQVEPDPYEVELAALKKKYNKN